MMKQLYISLFVLLLSVSCSDRGFREGAGAEGEEVTTITVTYELPKAAPGILPADAGEGDSGNIGGKTTYPGDVDPILNKDFVAGESLLYISQMGPSVNPQFTDMEPTANPYCYVYKYYENSEADWSKEYNFKLADSQRNPINWATVKSVGSVGNAFSMYAFHFPVENAVRFRVESDQTDEINFRTSDVMGAYHATSALLTRLRFRLFHLMVYLKVTLYVPVYEDKVIPGSDPDRKYSGFEPGSFKGAYVMNAYTDWTVEWRANRSSDTEAPLVQTLTNATKAHIKMYTYPYDDETPVTLENVSSFYPSYKGDGDADKVMVYNFSVLFPSQTFGDNFLCFGFEDPEGEMRYFYFSGSQVVGDSGNYGPTQGSLQQLYLYLPRTTNQTVLVGAKVLPWAGTSTDMTVTKDPKSGDDDKKD